MLHAFGCFNQFPNEYEDCTNTTNGNAMPETMRRYVSSHAQDIVSGPSDEDNYEDDDEKDGEQKTKREAAAGTNDDDGDEGSDFSELQARSGTGCVFFALPRAISLQTISKPSSCRPCVPFLAHYR